MKNKVSVIIPVYNHGGYIAKAIDSVLKQSFQNFEILVVNDGSTDNTAKELKRISDKRLRVISLKKNSGMSNAMNKCIENATGEYIAHLNADDLFSVDKLEKQVAFLDKNANFGAVFTRASIIDENGENFSNEDHFYYSAFDKENRCRFEWLNHFFYKGNCLCHPSVMIRKKCFDEVGFYDPRFQQVQDLEFWTRFFQKYDAHIMEEKLTFFRIFSDESNSSGNTLAKRIRYAWEATKLLENYLKLSVVDFEKVFPNMEFRNPLEEDLLPYYIARAALDLKNHIYDHFGIETIFNFLKNSESARKLEKLEGFSSQDYIKLTTTVDVFGIKEREDAQQESPDSFRKKIHLKNIEIEEKDRHIQLIETSKFWKLREKYLKFKELLRK
jgi:glycosyltransferase involved in cell wall biosynthesis